MKGILMKPDMIQATVDHRKTHTRRLGGLKEINQAPNGWDSPIKVVNDTKPAKAGDWLFQHKTQLTLCVIARPEYKVGETVYIKEAWKAGLRDDGAYLTLYKDGGSKLGLCEPAAHRFAHYERKWQSPFFMPQSAARHFIKILAVTAERLQEITPEDAYLEGFPLGQESWKQQQHKALPYCINGFQETWNSLNPKYPFESNPWVFPYDFELVRETR